MAKKKKTPKKALSKKKSSKAPKPRSFSGVIKGRSRDVQTLARAIRDLIFEELPDAQESFHGGPNPLAMYRTLADVCWIQPLKERCNLYFTRGLDLTDDDGLLEGSSDRFRHVKVRGVEDVDRLPLREWLRKSVELNESAVGGTVTYDEVLERLRAVCLALPKSKETRTWGMPHFRVGEKIFCGCGEQHGQPMVGLKMEVAESQRMMKAPGIDKAPYSRPNDGWVTINACVFDDWSEIERMIVGSYRLIAPRRVAALLDS